MPTIPISMARRYLMGNRVTLRFRTCSRWIVQPREENSTTSWDHAWRHGASMDYYTCVRISACSDLDFIFDWTRFLRPTRRQIEDQVIIGMPVHRLSLSHRQSVYNFKHNNVGIFRTKTCMLHVDKLPCCSDAMSGVNERTYIPEAN